MQLLGITSNEDLKLIKQKADGTLMSKCKKLLEHWKKGTPKSQCRWEQVIDSLHTLNLEELAEELAEALAEGKRIMLHGQTLLVCAGEFRCKQ